MGGLVIEENVGTEGGEDILHLDSPQEKGLVHPDTPLPQCIDGPFMGRGIPGSDKGGSDGEDSRSANRD